MNGQRLQARIVARMVLAALLASVAACAPVRPPQGSFPVAVPAPVYRTGDTWTYAARNSFSNETVGHWRYAVVSANGEIRMAITRGAADVTDIEIADAPGEFRLHALPNLPVYRFANPFVVYGFPLAPGRSWNHTVSAYNTATQRNQNVRVMGWVGGWERIQVPAGDYDAIRIERATYADDGDYLRTQTEIFETEWYAPEIGAIIKHEERSQWKPRNVRGMPIYQNDRTTLELTAFERAPR